MQNLTSTIPKNEPLLLHSCCGPCSSSVMEKLTRHFKVSLFFANCNIWPKEEFARRKEEQIKLLKSFPQGANVCFFTKVYNHNDFLTLTKDNATSPEGGARCAICFEMRLNQTALFAKENGTNGLQAP